MAIASAVITPGNDKRLRGNRRRQSSAPEGLQHSPLPKRRRRSSVMEVDESRRQTLIRDFFCVKPKEKGGEAEQAPPPSRSGTGTTMVHPVTSARIGSPAASPLQRIDTNTGSPPPAKVSCCGGSGIDNFPADGRSMVPPRCRFEKANPGEEASNSATLREASELTCEKPTSGTESEGITRSAPHKKANGNGGSQRRYQQLFLDLGQRDFAQRQFCGVCGMMVVHGVEEDLKEHERICRDYTLGVAFHSETARAVASPSRDSIVYQIRPGDSQILWKKVGQVRAIVDKDLGFVPDCDDSTSCSTFLYARKKRIIGLCTVLPIRRAYALSASNSERSTQAQKAAIGIHQLWVHSKFRREGVATALLDAVREKMFFGLFVPASQLAFSSPTLAGALFARHYVSKYSGSSDILVYDLNRVTT